MGTNRIRVPLLLAMLVAAHASEPASRTGFTVVGQLLLPPGEGSRGVEVILTESGPQLEPRVWLFFDDEGKFARTLQGNPALIQVMAGAGREVHRIDATLLDRPREGKIDLGVIDLRERLERHRFVLRAAEGRPSGDVRVAMWNRPPPRGPGGGTVSLGSRQFPPVALGSEVEWLLPPDAESVYFLVERPADAGRGVKWRSGHQRLFGPFTSTDFPPELVMD
jgi:hypothetical protein